MVVKMSTPSFRGAAGESTMGPRRGYNFANLRQLNRADDQIKTQADTFESQASGLKNSMADAVKSATAGAGGVQDRTNAIVEQGKQLANKTENYSPAAEAMKAGNSAYQSGVAGFYAGGNNSADVQRIRKFGGIYTSLLGQQQNALGKTPISANQTQPIKPIEKTGPYANYSQEMGNINNINRDQGRNDQINSLGSLDYGLKTGRITAEQYYRAQNDPAYYQELSKWLGEQ